MSAFNGLLWRCGELDAGEIASSRRERGGKRGQGLPTVRRRGERPLSIIFSVSGSAFLVWRSVYVGATLENVRGAKTGGASGQVKGQRRLGCGGGRVWLIVLGF